MAFLAATLGWSGAARADLITYQLTGTITNVDDLAYPITGDKVPINLLAGLVMPGDSFEATLTLDPGDGSSFFVSGFSLTITAGSWQYQDPFGQNGLYFPDSSLFFLSTDNVVVPGVPLLDVPRASGALLTDRFLEIHGATPSWYYGNPQFTIFGIMSVRSVPEPGSAAILLAGAVGLAALRGWRRRQSPQ